MLPDGNAGVGDYGAGGGGRLVLLFCRGRRRRLVRPSRGPGVLGRGRACRQSPECQNHSQEQQGYFLQRFSPKSLSNPLIHRLRILINFLVRQVLVLLSGAALAASGPQGGQRLEKAARCPPPGRTLRTGLTGKRGRALEELQGHGLPKPFGEPSATITMTSPRFPLRKWWPYYRGRSGSGGQGLIFLKTGAGTRRREPCGILL